MPIINTIYWATWSWPTTDYTITWSIIVGSYTPGQFTDLQWFYISPNGLKAYATFWNNWSGKFAQYSLSTAWDISTATQVQNISVTKPNWFDFSKNWNYIFLSTENWNKIIRYTLSTPRDLSTATLDTGQSISVGSPFASKVNISPDWHYIFYPTTANNLPLYRYELTTAFDLSTATNYTYINTSNLCSTVSKDGKFIYKALDIGSEVTQYSLATPYDITSAQTEVGRYNVSYSEGRCLYISEDWKYWTIWNTSSWITQYEAQPIS